MRLLRAAGALGFVSAIAASCTNDFDQFDFDGAQSNAAGPSKGGTMVAETTGGFGGSAPRGGRGGRAGAGNGGTSGAGTSAAGGEGANGGDGGAGNETSNGGEPAQAGAGAMSGNGGSGGTGGGSGEGGAGAPGCPIDQQQCDGDCVPLTALDHCGNCTNVCAVGFICDGTGCACDDVADCAAIVTGGAGAGGESAGGVAGDSAGGAPSVTVQCVAGRCVCGVTECAQNQRCQANGSCG